MNRNQVHKSCENHKNCIGWRDCSKRASENDMHALCYGEVMCVSKYMKRQTTMSPVTEQ